MNSVESCGASVPEIRSFSALPDDSVSEAGNQITKITDFLILIEVHRFDGKNTEIEIGGMHMLGCTLWVWAVCEGSVKIFVGIC
ncbi:Zinc finger CCCH domain-containing protein 24 [Spatholobus suberectus]|nr:Zinc finger CCCH domain-containing protein 24 [Spatholobus suberectus]